MDVIFGWGLDGADWATWAGGREASLGCCAVGPRGFADLLATRLGVGEASVDHALRIAAYRDAIAEADPGWCRASFELTPWAVAKKMLAWRDELVSAGWDGRAVPAMSPRLLALAGAEEFFGVPGDADVLRAILRELRTTPAGDAAPIGIRAVTVVGDRGSLPHPWPAILDGLEARGIAVDREPEGEIRKLRIIAADTEWEAADAAARILRHEPGRGVIAGGSTQILDQELGRRGLPRVGIGERSAQRPAHELLPLAFRVFTEPVDTRALASFLDVRVPVVGGGPPRTTPLIPWGVRTKLLSSLSQEAGFGGRQWEKNAAAIADPDDRAVYDELLALLRDPVSPRRSSADGGSVYASRNLIRVADSVLSLATRAAGRTGASLREDEPFVRFFGTTIRVLGGVDEVSPASLRQILASCAPETAAPVVRGEAEAPASSRPAPAPGPECAPPGPVLWWNAIDPELTLRPTWTPAETAVLSELGCHPASPRTVARASTAAALAGLRRSGDVIAMVPRSLEGKEPSAHAALVFAAAAPDPAAPDAGTRDTGTGTANAGSQDPAPTVDELLKRRTVDVSRCVDGDAADLRDLYGDGVHMITPEPWSPDDERVRAASCERRIPEGRLHLPTTLSFSQINALVGHGLEWYLENRLRIRIPWYDDLAGDNRMKGTFLHAIVERIVEEESSDMSQHIQVSGKRIEGLFDKLAPKYASPLLQPGREPERDRLRRQAIDSIGHLFRTLEKRGLRPIASEQEFAFDLELTLADPEAADRVEHHTVTVGGTRDLDLEDSDGRRSVLDLKYTSARNRYGDLLRERRALQLALYARSVVAELPTDAEPPALSSIPTGYFLLGQNEFVSAHPEFTDTPLDDPHPDELWNRTIRTLERILSRMRFGNTISDLRNELRTLDDHSRETRIIDLEADGYVPPDAHKYAKFDTITGAEADNR